mmetsp:Transcript_89920/g.160007  ORF Transcript_89920/g.160007 Transcript_89920/m.160007 type:complete len:220 (+) Transcript_89920:123-782(+)
MRTLATHLATHSPTTVLNLSWPAASLTLQLGLFGCLLDEEQPATCHRAVHCDKVRSNRGSRSYNAQEEEGDARKRRLTVRNHKAVDIVNEVEECADDSHCKVDQVLEENFDEHGDHRFLFSSNHHEHRIHHGVPSCEVFSRLPCSPEAVSNILHAKGRPNPNLSPRFRDDFLTFLFYSVNVSPGHVVLVIGLLASSVTGPKPALGIVIAIMGFVHRPQS